MKLKYVFFAQLAIKELNRKGVENSAIFSIPGIALNRKDPLDSEVSIEFIHHLVLLYKEQLQTAHCGLEIIGKLDFQTADFFGPYAFSCPTLGEAVQKIYAVHKQLNPLVSYELTPAEKPSHFVYHLDKMWEAKYPESAREIIEFIIASGVLSARSLTRHDIRPLKLRLKYEAPDDTALYDRIFKCPVYFGLDSNSITYAADVVDYKIPTYNPALLQILQEFAQKTIHENEQKKDIVSRVKTLIMKAGDNGIPKEEEVASSLNMGKRTLQKRLQEKNTSFLNILDDIQKELALAYLGSGTISNKEISWMLGYNDISNFYRAFRRWTGMTPNEYKEGVL